MLERTIAISARHLASSEVEKLFITVKCPESLLPSYRSVLQFLEFNIRKFIRTEGIRDHGQEAIDGPAPDNIAIEAEAEERRATIQVIKEAEWKKNREENALPPIKATTATVPAIAASGTNYTPREAAGEHPTAWARRKLAAMDKAKAPKKK